MAAKPLADLLPELLVDCSGQRDARSDPVVLDVEQGLVLPRHLV
jgi:hypothetical protein